jgi:hypothetical protein
VKLDWSTFADEPAPQPPKDRGEIVPHGTHRGTIKSAKEQQGWRVTPQNPSGDVVSFGVDFSTDAKRFQWIFYAIPANDTRALVEFCKLIGVPGPQPGEADWDELECEGCPIYAQTDSYIIQRGPNAGSERGSIVKVLPLPPKTELPQERRARHDPNEIVRSGKKQLREAGSDDIPF